MVVRQKSKHPTVEGWEVAEDLEDDA